MKISNQLIMLLVMLMTATKVCALEYVVDFSGKDEANRFHKDEATSTFINEIGGIHWVMFASADKYIPGNPSFQLCTKDTPDKEITLELSGFKGVITAIEFTAWRTDGTNKATVSLYDDNISLSESEVLSGNSATAVPKVFENLSLNGKFRLVFKQPATGSKYGMYMGRIKVTYTPPIDITMDQNNDNAELLRVNEGKVVNLTLKRSFTNDGWYTLCLPFSLSKETAKSVFGEQVEIEEFVSVKTNPSGQQELTFAESKDGITAGVPCLIKPSKADVTNPLFEGVVITALEPQTVEIDGYKFVGTFSSSGLDAVETIRLLGGSDGTVISRVSEAGDLLGSRCYFVFPSAFSNVAMRVSLGDTTGIDDMVHTTPETGTKGIYTLQGIKIAAPKTLPAGIYIIDGKKVMINNR